MVKVYIDGIQYDLPVTFQELNNTRTSLFGKAQKKEGTGRKLTVSSMSNTSYYSNGPQACCYSCANNTTQAGFNAAVASYNITNKDGTISNPLDVCNYNSTSAECYLAVSKTFYTSSTNFIYGVQGGYYNCYSNQSVYPYSNSNCPNSNCP